MSPQKNKDDSKMKDILIVGAGPVGSLLSIYLAKAGHRVKVYERRPDMRRHEIPAGRSINLACSDRGFFAMDTAGVGDRIRDAAIPMNGRVMHSTSRELTYQAYGEAGQAIYAISRGGINEELICAADEFENVTFEFDQKCTRVSLDDPSASFEHVHSREKTTVKPDILFGADGAFSAVRKQMMRGDRFNYHQHYLPHGYKELFIPAGTDNTFQIEKNALHIWPRGDHMLIALPNADGSFTCTLFMPFEGAQGSFEALSDPQSARTFFEDIYPDAIDRMPTFDHDFQANPTSSLVTIRCSPWVHQDKVALVGDASHAIVPFYGQGMNSGLEDCRIFGECLNEGGSDWHQILKLYQARRKENADAIAELALRNFTEMRDSVGNPNFLLKKKIERKIADLFPGEFTPTYSMVTFSQTPYATALRLGDRQEEFLESILKQDGIANRLNDEDFTPELVKAYQDWRETFS
jgi:kynurenine 3-monooxygenase